MLTKRFLLTAAVAALTGAAMLPHQAAAQVAGRPINIIVPYTPGSGPDILARAIGEVLQQRYNQPVVVENKPGASGNIGAQQVANAAPDGNTIMMTTNPFTANLSLFKNVPYDPIKSFAPIVSVGTGALVLAVHPSVPAANTQEFIAYVKSKPGQINFGSPGVGTPHHLAMELFKLVTKADMTHVPYRGSAGATTDLIGGHVAAGFQAVHVILPMAKNNQVKLLATAGRERVAIAPDVPTLHEQGLTDFDVNLWYAILAPAGTAPDVIAKYNATINEILQLPAILAKLTAQGLTVDGGAPERLRDFLARDIAKWKKVVADAGIAVQ
jgi:tripartite-type tricarboxylate transporter receptor subunit TctC